MFCQKCGNQLSKNSKFCSECGGETPYSQTTQKTIENETTIQEDCLIKFIPRKIFGQWLLRKATIEVSEISQFTKIKKAITFRLPAGTQNVHCYANYLGQSCKVDTSFLFKAGRKYEIKYNTSFIIFFKGKLSIQEIF